MSDVLFGGVSLCPEAALRSAMTEDEFWEHVYGGPDEGDEWEPPQIDAEDMASLSHLDSPCPECGQVGACAYDAEGRALIHGTGDEDV